MEINIPENKHLGKLCLIGHDWNYTGKSLRYKSNENCVECAIEYVSKWQKKNPEKVNIKNRKWKKNNSDKVKEMWDKYYEKKMKNNPEKLSMKMKKWRADNPDKAKESQNKHWQKNKLNPQFRLNHSIRCALGKSLKYNGLKNWRHWEDLVGYTGEDLKQYIEKQFTEGMSWEKYLDGKLHIDHIIPISAFNFSAPEHLDFKRCWALKNLQPMWAKENLQKSNKLEQDFQPSLAL